MPILNAPDTKRINLSKYPESDPAWVEVTTRTSAGETELMTDMGASQKTSPGMLILMTVVAMIKDWNFTDDKGEKLPITLETVRYLDPQDFFEIQEAVDISSPGPTMTPQKKRRSSTTSSKKPTS